MSFGVITNGVSDVVEWQIPEFSSSIDVHYIDSSRFLLEGCTWYLRMHPPGNENGRWLSVYLHIGDPEITAKTVTFSLGIKNKDGVLEEKERCKCTYKTNALSWGKQRFLTLEDLVERGLELVPSDTLTITCRMERETPTPGVAALKLEKGDSRNIFMELETLSSDLKDLLSSERKCDFTIFVQGKVFRTHRLLLSARSSVFRAMLEHDTAEAKSGILTIPDCDAESFGEFLSFLYTGKTEEMTFRTAYHLYATTEKYDIQQLKSFCACYLKQNLTAENVCDVVVLADRYGDEELLSSAQSFFNKNSCGIFLTSEWKAMLKQNVHLADKLLSEMAFETFKVSKNKKFKTVT